MIHPLMSRKALVLQRRNSLGQAVALLIQAVDELSLDGLRAAMGKDDSRPGTLSQAGVDQGWLYHRLKVFHDQHP